MRPMTPILDFYSVWMTPLVALLVLHMRCALEDSYVIPVLKRDRSDRTRGIMAWLCAHCAVLCLYHLRLLRNRMIPPGKHYSLLASR